jgi:hypothetical protein
VKQKGRNLQNRIAKDLAKITELKYGSPNDDLADLRGRLMGTPGADIVRSRTAMDLTPFYVECKNSESWSLGKRMFQDGLGQLIRWYLSTSDKAASRKDDLRNIPIVVAAQAHVAPIVVISENRFNKGDLVRSYGVICTRVPVSRFLDSKKEYTSVSYLAIVDILSWEDFLRLWYGDKK